MSTSSSSPAASDAQALLQVRQLSAVFDTPTGQVHAVNGVSFDVAPGSVLGVVGESGSGKSVTARAIMRMVRWPGRTQAEHVLLDGKDLQTLDDAQLRERRGRDLAMVFQDPQSALNPMARIGEQIAEALIVHGASAQQARARTLELLEQVGIPDVERNIDLYPHQFSGGMRQRVVIAIALANKPKLLIADEPTTALDVTIQAQILRLLADLRRDLGVAIMMITHDMGVVAELCDRVVVMYAGRIVEQGSVREVFESPQHPYTAALLKAVPRLGGERSSLVAIPGTPPDPSRLPVGCAFCPRCNVSLPQCLEQRPPLQEISAGHSSACWVAQNGGAVAVNAPAHARTRPERTAAGQAVLEVHNLVVDVGSARRGFFGRSPPVYAVNGVSLQVHAGQTLGLVGESGCGKSTLSRAIVGINRVHSGQIKVHQQDVTAMQPGQRQQVAKALQYVFQDPYASLNPRRSIAQSLAEAIEVAAPGERNVVGRSIELLERVGLSASHLYRFPHEFSGGQRQRIGIARALAANPQALILDEPVSALDVSIQAQIIGLLEELRDDLGLGYLFIAHDLSVVRHLSDQLAVMYLGRIVETGDAQTLYTQPSHPYTVSLLSSTPEPEVGRDLSKRIVLTGDLPSPANPPTGCPFRTRCPIGPAFQEGRALCQSTRPELQTLSAGQHTACHFPGELRIVAQP